MSNEGPKGYVNKLHLVYIVICFTLVLILILAMTIWQNESAGVGLNNAATASSIVLAVVAIVMTIVDIAGQRKTVMDLKDTAETLEVNLFETNKSLEMVRILEESLSKSMSSIQKSHSEIIERISILQKSYESDENVDNNKLIQDLEMLKYGIGLQPVGRTLRNNISNDKALKNYILSSKISSILQNREGLSLNEIMKIPGIEITGCSRAEIKNEITRMVRENKVLNNNGVYSLRN